MRQLSRFLIQAPARFLEAEYSLSYTSILRMDKEILAHDIPKPKMDGMEGILIDEKHLGASKGFATLVVNAATGEPLDFPSPGRWSPLALPAPPKRLGIQPPSACPQSS